MKIKSVRIQNFRAFKDETIQFNRYSCLVGPNGAGKSTVLCALNVFFQEQELSPTTTTKLCDEDFFGKSTDNPIVITVTFDGLSDEAKAELSHYVRQDELIVKAVARFDAKTGVGTVQHFGSRLAMVRFSRFFAMYDDPKVKAPELTSEFEQIRTEMPNVPKVDGRVSKAAQRDVLGEYEAAHPELCEPIDSSDNFYGVAGTGKLAKFVQWIYVPAVKAVEAEGEAGKTNFLGKLISRAVQARSHIEEQINSLKQRTLDEYNKLLENSRSSLDEISKSLERRLQAWAHPDAKIGLGWQSDAFKAVVLQQPMATIKTGDGPFMASLSRMDTGFSEVISWHCFKK
jgi:energy-coupling factor transporter ATP-binding protein EcfA2